jgi:hypothetical protein
MQLGTLATVESIEYTEYKSDMGVIVGEWAVFKRELGSISLSLDMTSRTHTQKKGLCLILS